jgi:hypothetical protein
MFYESNAIPAHERESLAKIALQADVIMFARYMDSIMTTPRTDSPLSPRMGEMESFLMNKES